MNFMHGGTRTDAGDVPSSGCQGPSHVHAVHAVDRRDLYTEIHADMDLSATYMIWRSDVICCKTPGPRVGLSHVKQSGALWTYRAQTAIISTALAVCEERVLGSNSHHLSIARKG
jgi:hypothetical protein